MKYGSLFSGIGGFDLGLDQAGMECTWQVEIDEFCRRVLTKHWPDVPKFTDVRECGKHNLEPVDLICGGFPCQDISLAGKGAGLTGERSGLWSQFRRIIEEIAPSWVVIENVAALRSRGLDQVLGEVSALGYDAEWHCIPASAVGAPHRRDRVWIVAHTDRESTQRPTVSRIECDSWPPEPDLARVVNGVSVGVESREERVKALGNALVPQIAEMIGRAIMESR